MSERRRRRQGGKHEGKAENLVVENDRRMVKTICDILKVKGHRPSEAHSGEEAVDKVEKEEFDCVLMDLKMPGIDAKSRGACTVFTKPIDIQILLLFLSMLRKEESVLVVDDPAFWTIKDLPEQKGYHVETEMVAVRVLDRTAMERNYKLIVILDIKLGNADVLSKICERYPANPVAGGDGAHIRNYAARSVMLCLFFSFL